MIGTGKETERGMEICSQTEDSNITKIRIRAVRDGMILRATEGGEGIIITIIIITTTISTDIKMIFSTVFCLDKISNTFRKIATMQFLCTVN